MTETPFFFDGNGYRLFGVLHEQAGQVKKEGFVFCAPFAEEKLWAHRVLLNFARDLADNGYPVLRFDYMGNGDSEGDFRESSFATMLSDTECAIRMLREKISALESINLIGLRLGATIAALYAQKMEDASKLILWDPIVNGSHYIREILRINLSTQTAVYKKILHNTDALVQMMKEGKTVNIDGYEMSYPLYEDIAGIDLLGSNYNYKGRVLIVQISRKENSTTETFKNLRDKYVESELVCAVEEPFWKEIRYYYSKANNLYQATRNWLRGDDQLK